MLLTIASADATDGCSTAVAEVIANAAQRRIALPFLFKETASRGLLRMIWSVN
jgi:hypothetical protein